ncbi:YiaA/YiaB family inner membrane protein [Paenibacillus sp. GCM10028914]|uniref:YiaA/YiaB family inner membrane protein n=1 Tax=Paenibacillus sp. GCM10028914 TaxID=3273416 RepID=UPI003609BF3A
MHRRKRNTFAFTALAWLSFVLALSFVLVALFNAKWELVEKGYYAACTLWVISAAIVLQKVVRDNEEDKDMYGEGGSRKRNTFAFTGLAWASFLLALGFILVALWNADWPLVEKGYYAGCTLWAISASIVLQKVVRDNEEDKDFFPPTHSEDTKFDLKS